MRRFLVDNQLPAALTRWLRDKDQKAEHVLDLNLGQSPDTLIWQRAAELGAVIVTKDEDFAQLTILQPDTAVLLASFERLWLEKVQQLETGARLIEVY